MSGPDGAYDGLLSQAREFGRSANPEAALRGMQASMQALQEKINQVRTAEFTGADGSGWVTAVVTGDGTLRRVDISARALRDLPADQLGPACLAAIQQARLGMASGLQEQLSELVGRPLVDPDALPSPSAAIQQAMTRNGGGQGPWS